MPSDDDVPASPPKRARVARDNSPDSCLGALQGLASDASQAPASDDDGSQRAFSPPPSEPPNEANAAAENVPGAPSWDIEHDDSISAADVARACFRPLPMYPNVHCFPNSTEANIFMFADVIEGPRVPDAVNDFLHLVVEMRDMLSQGCPDKARFVFPFASHYDVQRSRDQPTQITTHGSEPPIYHEMQAHLRLLRVVHKSQDDAAAQPGSPESVSATQFRPIFFLVAVVSCPQPIHFRRGISLLNERSDMKRNDDAARRTENKRALSSVCSRLAEHFPHVPGTPALFDTSEKLFSRVECAKYLTPLGCMRGILTKAACMHSEYGVADKDLRIEGWYAAVDDWLDESLDAVYEAARSYEMTALEAWTTIAEVEEKRKKGPRRREEDGDGPNNETEYPVFLTVANRLCMLFAPSLANAVADSATQASEADDLPLAIPSHESVVLLYWRAMESGAVYGGERLVPNIPSSLACMLIRDDADWAKGGIADVGVLNDEAERDSTSGRSRGPGAQRSGPSSSSASSRPVARALSRAVMMDVVMKGDSHDRSKFEPLVQSMYKDYRRTLDAAIRHHHDAEARFGLYRRLVGTLIESALVAIKSETFYHCGELQAAIECFARPHDMDLRAAALYEEGEDSADARSEDANSPRASRSDARDARPPPDAMECARRRLRHAMGAVVGNRTCGLLDADASADWALSPTQARHLFNARCFEICNGALALDPLNLHLLVMIKYNRPFAMHDFQNGVVAAAPQHYGGTFWVCAGGGMYEKADGERMLFKPYGCGFSYVQELVHKLMHPLTYGIETVAKYDGDAQMNSATTLAITMQHAVKTTTDMTSGRVTVSSGKKSKASRLWFGEMTDPGALFFYFNRDGARRVQETTEGSGGARNGNDSGRRLVRYHFVITPALEAVTTNRFVNPESDRPNAIAEVTRLTSASEQKSKSSASSLGAGADSKSSSALSDLVERCVMLDETQLACLVANLQSEGVVGRVDEMLPSVRDIWHLFTQLLACAAEGEQLDPASREHRRVASYAVSGPDMPPSSARCLVLNHDPRRASRLDNATRARAVTRSTSVMSGALVTVPFGPTLAAEHPSRAAATRPMPGRKRPFVEYLSMASINIKFNPLDPATLPAAICDYIDQILRPAIFIPVFIMARELGTPVPNRHALIEWFSTGDFAPLSTSNPELCEWWEHQCHIGNILTHNNIPYVTLGTKAAPGQANAAPACSGLHAAVVEPVSAWCTQLANSMVAHFAEDIERANLTAELLTTELARFVDRPQMLPPLCGSLAAADNPFLLLGHDVRTNPFMKGPATLRNTGPAKTWPALARIGHSYRAPASGAAAGALPVEGRLAIDFRFFLWAVSFAADGVEATFSRASVSINSTKHVTAHLAATFFERHAPPALFPFTYVCTDLPSRSTAGLLGVSLQRNSTRAALLVPDTDEVQPAKPTPPCTLLRRVQIVPDNAPRPAGLPPSWQLHWDSRNTMPVQVLETLSFSGVTEDNAPCEVWARTANYLCLDRLRQIDRGVLVCASRFGAWLPALDTQGFAVCAYRVDRPRATSGAGFRRGVACIASLPPTLGIAHKQLETDDILAELGLIPLPHICRHGAVVLMDRDTSTEIPAADGAHTDRIVTAESMQMQQERALVPAEAGSRAYGVLMPRDDTEGPQWFGPDGLYRVQVPDAVSALPTTREIGPAELYRNIVPYGSHMLVNFESLQKTNLYHCVDRVFLRPRISMAKFRTPPYLWATLALVPEDDVRTRERNTRAFLQDTVAVHAIECRTDFSVVGTRARTTETIVLHIVNIHDLACPEDVPPQVCRGMYGIYTGKQANWRTTQLQLAALGKAQPRG